MLNTFLSGIRVLDLSQYLPGPFATQQLADMGADVIKVEPPKRDPLYYGLGGDETFSADYQVMNAGKRICVLDLKTEEAKATFTRMLGRADVLMESFRPGVMDRLGFGPERLKEINPRLVHCALSGFGQTGPYRLVTGHDLSYVALSGGLANSGTVETPVITWPPMSDHAGAAQAVTGILGALVRRARTGEGASIDVSMAESLMAWQADGFTAALKKSPKRGQDIINGGAAFYQIYACADGCFVALCPLEPKYWANFCTAVGRTDWIDRQGEALPQTALIADVAGLFKTRDRAAWDALLLEADCCYQGILDYSEVPDHPHTRARGFVKKSEDRVEVLFPAYVDGNPPSDRAPLAEVGAEDVLSGWEGRP
ncbi:MAG: CaiB/BaiF CoA transferase family protein [Rhodospirillales bacterium]